MCLIARVPVEILVESLRRCSLKYLKFPVKFLEMPLEFSKEFIDFPNELSKNKKNLKKLLHEIENGLNVLGMDSPLRNFARQDQAMVTVSFNFPKIFL